MQINGTGVKFPNNHQLSGVIIRRLDSEAFAKTTIYVGSNPQTEQIWEVNQDVQIAGNTIRLISITAQTDGYSFRIDPGMNLSSVSVQIEGHHPDGAGGGEGTTNGKVFNTSLIYSELPKGDLTVLFSNPRLASPTSTWQAVWQPETIRNFSSIDGPSTTCLNADTIQNINPLPSGFNGKVVLTQLNPQLQIDACRDGWQPATGTCSRQRTGCSHAGQYSLGIYHRRWNQNPGPSEWRVHCE